jgi:hypothetical protein
MAFSEFDPATKKILIEIAREVFSLLDAQHPSSVIPFSARKAAYLAMRTFARIGIQDPDALRAIGVLRGAQAMETIQKRGR